MLVPAQEGKVSNFHAFKEKIQSYVSMHYGDIGIIFSSMKYPKADPPEVPNEASLAADPHGLIRSVFLELVKLYKKKIDTLREKKINVFALLHGQMSEESKCEVGSIAIQTKSKNNATRWLCGEL